MACCEWPVALCLPVIMLNIYLIVFFEKGGQGAGNIKIDTVLVDGKNT